MSGNDYLTTSKIVGEGAADRLLMIGMHGLRHWGSVLSVVADQCGGMTLKQLSRQLLDDERTYTSKATIFSPYIYH